jgi:hypothetical protein
MNAAALRNLPSSSAPGGACPTCSQLRCAGWESLGGSFDRSRLRRIGTLNSDGEGEPTLREHHPNGTNAWSADAPIAVHFFPYNRCDVWCCNECQRPFLRYTEYGGYYLDERIREVNPSLVDDSSAPD